MHLVIQFIYCEVENRICTFSKTFLHILAHILCTKKSAETCIKLMGAEFCSKWLFTPTHLHKAELCPNFSCFQMQWDLSFNITVLLSVARHLWVLIWNEWLLLSWSLDVTPCVSVLLYGVVTVAAKAGPSKRFPIVVSFLMCLRNGNCQRQSVLDFVVQTVQMDVQQLGQDGWLSQLWGH